jgi:hypothetical protein
MSHRSSIRHSLSLLFLFNSVQEYVLARKIEVWLDKLKIQGHTFEWHNIEDFDGSVPWRSQTANTTATKIIYYRYERWRRIDPRDENLREIPALAVPEEFAFILSRFKDNMVCADARDRVYSLISLLGPETQKKLSINPDYTKTTSELFASVVISFARLLLSPESWRGHINVEYGIQPESKRSERGVEYKWEYKRDVLLSTIQNLQTMLRLSENDVAVQNVRLLIKKDTSLATFSNSPGIRVEVR